MIVNLLLVLLGLVIGPLLLGLLVYSFVSETPQTTVPVVEQTPVSKQIQWFRAVSAPPAAKTDGKNGFIPPCPDRLFDSESVRLFGSREIIERNWRRTVQWNRLAWNRKQALFDKYIPDRSHFLTGLDAECEVLDRATDEELGWPLERESR